MIRSATKLSHTPSSSPTRPPEVHFNMENIHSGVRRLLRVRTSENLRDKVVQMARRKLEKEEHKTPLMRSEEGGDPTRSHVERDAVQKKRDNTRTTIVLDLKKNGISTRVRIERAAVGNSTDREIKVHCMPRGRYSLTELQPNVDPRSVPPQSPVLPRSAAVRRLQKDANLTEVHPDVLSSVTPQAPALPRSATIIRLQKDANLTGLNPNVDPDYVPPQSPSLPRSAAVRRQQNDANLTEVDPKDDPRSVHPQTPSVRRSAAVRRQQKDANLPSLCEKKAPLSPATGKENPTDRAVRSNQMTNSTQTPSTVHQRPRSQKESQARSGEENSGHQINQNVSLLESSKLQKDGRMLSATCEPEVTLQEPIKRMRACLGTERRGPRPKSLRFHGEECSSHYQSTGSSGENPGAQAAQTQEVCEVRGNVVSSTPQSSLYVPFQRLDNHKRVSTFTSNLEMFKRRLRLNHNRFIKKDQLEEDCVIELQNMVFSAKDGRQARKEAPPDESSLPKREDAKWDHPDDVDKVSEKFFITEDDRAPLPRVRTYVVEEDIAKTLTGREPVTLTLHNLSLHNTLLQRRIDRELRMRVRRAEQERKAKAAVEKKETEPVCAVAGDGSQSERFNEKDSRLWQWLTEVEKNCDNRPLVEFKLAA